MKKILLISPTPSHPQNAGNRARVYSLLASIKAMGHDLYFLYLPTESGGDLESMKAYWGNRFHHVPYSEPKPKIKLVAGLRRLITGAALSIDDWYDPALDRVLISLSKNIRFDVVMVEYVFFSRALNNFGAKVLKIVDTIDVFSNRHERMIQQGLQPNWYSASPQEEARGLNRADIVIAISKEDQEFLSRLASKEVITIGHIVPLYQPAPYQSAQSGKMLFVGSANPMNAQAVLFFVEQVQPLIKAHLPSAQLLIAGPVCDLLPDRHDYVKLGIQRDLRPIYASVDVVISPMRFGTGLSIKNLEALGHGKPLVTTSIGARGLDGGAGEAFVVADTPGEFSSVIVDLLSDSQYSEKLSKKAYDFATQWNRRNMTALESLLNA